MEEYNQLVNTRDKTLDRLRGFAMMWVIVVHVLYWGNFFASAYINLLKSFCLFEMPLFFFITGASHSFSNTGRYFKFVQKKFLRVLIPYWLFALICAFLSIVKYSIEKHISIIDIIQILLSWLIPINKQMTSVPYLTWALWFIPVYLCIVLIIPMLNRIKQSNWIYQFGLLLFMLFLGCCLINVDVAQHIVFYSLWTFIGLFYKDIKTAITDKHIRKCLWIICAVSITLMCILSLCGHSLDMQSNKFPPNIMFLVYSSIAMALIILTLPYLDSILTKIEQHKLFGRILALFSTRSLTIFLYQVFAFNFTIRVSNVLFSNESVLSSIAKSAFCLATTIPACAGLGVIFGKAEKINIKIQRQHNATEDESVSN